VAVRVSRVERLAEQILSEAGCFRPPVSPDHLVDKYGATVVLDSFGGDTDVSGVLVREDDRVIIGVNRQHPVVRQRFTIAHELGHLLMHPGRPLIVEKQVRVNFRDSVSSMATDQQEIEANQFAAALLMPREWVEREGGELLQQNAAVREAAFTASLATTFQVSAQAMRIRLVNLGILGSWL